MCYNASAIFAPEAAERLRLWCNMSRATCHVPHLTCNTSSMQVQCNMSRATRVACMWSRTNPEGLSLSCIVCSSVLSLYLRHVTFKTHASRSIQHSTSASMPGVCVLCHVCVTYTRSSCAAPASATAQHVTSAMPVCGTGTTACTAPRM